jgi:hypothetical protein
MDVDDPPSDTESLAAGDPSESIEPIEPTVLFDERDKHYRTPPQSKPPRRSVDGNDEHIRETVLQWIVSSVRKSAKKNLAIVASASKSLFRSAQKTRR